MVKYLGNALQEKRSWRRYIPELVSLLTVFAMVVVLLLKVHAWERAALRTDFERRTQACVLIMQRAIDANMAALLSITDFHAAEGGDMFGPYQVDIREFQYLLQNIVKRSPQIDLIAWLPRIVDAHRRAFEQDLPVRANGMKSITQFSVNGRLKAVDRNEEYFPVRIVSPLEQNERYLGFDCSSVADSRARILKTTKKMQPTAGPVCFPSWVERHKLFDCQVLLPLYSITLGAKKPNRRGENLQGVALAVFRTHDLMEQALEEANVSDLIFEIAEGTEHGDHAEFRVFSAAGQPALANEATTAGLDARLKSVKLLYLGSTTWAVRFRSPDSGSLGFQYGRTWSIAAGGLLLVSLLGTYILIAMNRAARVENIVAERTEELRRANTELNREMTERKRAEEEALVQQEQLVRADKLATLGVLVSGVAHEVNNPNSVIMFQIPVIERVWKDAAPILDSYEEAHGEFVLGGLAYSDLKTEIPKGIARIRDGAKRIQRIIGDLRDFSRTGATEKHEHCSVEKVVRNAIILNTHLIKQSTEKFSERYTDDLPGVLGNYHRLVQVVINLLQNACQALTDQEQAIDVSVTFDSENGEIIVAVVDAGRGIGATHLQRLTEPFFTTKQESGGTGLGLSVSAGIVREHGGRLEFASVPDQGMSAKLILPVSPSIPPNNEEQA